MDSALSLNRSAPASGASIFANLHGRRAGCAADRRVAVVVKRVIRHVVPGNVIPDIVGGPRSERVYFNEPKLLIALDKARLPAGRRLIATNRRDPGAKSAEIGRAHVDGSRH